jgi:hypothetical protein
MTPDKVKELKRTCGEFLAKSGASIARKSGQSLAIAFWVGALSADETGSPYIQVCLVSGRVEELVEMPS